MEARADSGCELGRVGPELGGGLDALSLTYS
eukprot:CAMPEP_0175329668 /NCGR_PEP_ID=MMETSP0095-20121207/325_1 /TAXON_ID=311494 /ORGANISM="Alexandrium monilatum, Strain CCMP3105" /LENGTH=30 /DNA_ID= /DNA_START= /DNA_END= /DNA_ORIENTATION=